MDADPQQYTRQRGGTSQQCLERFAKRREKADSRREIQPRIETGLLWKLLSILFVQRRYSANGCCRGRFRHALGFGTKSCTASSRVERPGLSQNSSLQEERTRPQLGSGIRAENSSPPVENLTVPVGAAGKQVLLRQYTFTPTRFGHHLAHPEPRR